MSWEFKPRQFEPRAWILTVLQQPQEEGDTLTLTLRGFLSSVHSDFCVHVSVCVCAHMFARAAAVSSGASWTIPAEDAGFPCTLALTCPIPLTCSLGWVSGIPWQGEVRGSFQGRSLPTLHAPSSWVLIPTSCDSSYAGSTSPSVGILIYIIQRASMHTPRLDLTACCEGGLGSHRGGRKHD